MKEVIQKFCDYVTVICPLIIGFVNAFEASGVVELLGEKGLIVTSILGFLTTAASVTFNYVTGYYKKKEAADEVAE